ncbi:MAG TPA: hypothetical protein VHN37_10900 [Actinomycetota bacterium]|nr:hypothetical protein [Actinomycetota bacterium]
MKRDRRLVALVALCLSAAGSAVAEQPETFSSTYVGGEAGDLVNGLALAADGSVYVAGETSSTGFPAAGETTRVGAPAGGAADAFVAKVAPGAPEFEWVLILGGSDLDSAEAVVVTDRRIFVAGYTLSDDFPTESPALDAPDDDCRGTDSLCGADGWLAEVRPDGRGVDFSTYVGGSRLDQITDMSAAATGPVFVAGRTRSSDLPAMNGWRRRAARGVDDFVVRFSPRTRRFARGTYLGGNDDEGWPSVDVGAHSTVVVGSSTSSTDYPGPGAMEAGPRGDTDGVVALLGPRLGAVKSAVRIGGAAHDAIWDVSAEGRNRIAFVGTTSSDDFPTKRAFQSEMNGASDAFAASLDVRRHRLVFSTFLGGNHYDVAWGVDHRDGEVVVVGETPSADFPTRRGFQSESPSTECMVEDIHCTDAFVAVLGPRGALQWSSYVAGSRFDSVYAVAVDATAIVLAGLTHSPDFPEVSPPQPVMGGPYDGFLASFGS